jgi:cytosine/adenosine deaminase-related metal-dependent hydrolase
MLWRSPALFLDNALLLDPERDGEPVAGGVRIARGRIAELGGRARPRDGDARLDLAGALVLPGLVNAHDHLELNNFAPVKYREVYASSYQWADDIRPRLGNDPALVTSRAVPLADRLFLGGLKNLLAGTTSVAHHNPLHRPLRGRRFPVKVVRRYGWAHSLGLEPESARSYRRTPRRHPWIIHLAEGTDAVAAGELAALDAAGALGSNTVLVHGVGLSEPDRRRALAAGAALVWCPSSNRFLLGATARVADFAAARRLALGTDSRVTGARDLLDELARARAEEQVDVHALLRAVTIDGARILALGSAGRLSPGAPGDLLILPPPAPGDPADGLGRLRRADLRAVLVDGRVRVADRDFDPLLPGAVPVVLDGRSKILAPDLVARHARNAVAEPGLEMAAESAWARRPS